MENTKEEVVSTDSTNAKVEAMGELVVSAEEISALQKVSGLQKHSFIVTCPWDPGCERLDAQKDLVIECIDEMLEADYSM